MKSITKSQLKNNNRLKTLEAEMLQKVSESENKMTAKELKSHFTNRASLSTTISILKVSDQLKVSELLEVGTTVSVSYTIDGINLENIYIGRDGSNRLSGTLSNVFMNADNSIDLVVKQNIPVNQEYTFTTSYIGNITTQFTQTNTPIKSNSENQIITTQKNS